MGLMGAIVVPGRPRNVVGVGCGKQVQKQQAGRSEISHATISKHDGMDVDAKVL